MNCSLIISPNLEPAKCGVSDYSMVLGQLEKGVFGKEVFYLALNDKYINSSYQGQDMLRISELESAERKRETLIKTVRSLQPDKIYLNYVGYGYHKRGLPNWLLKACKELAKFNVPTILIVHELSIGNFSEEPFHFKVQGFFQNRLFSKLVQSLDASHVLTTTEIVRLLLMKKNIQSEFTPVFSNIPIVDTLVYNIQSEILRNLNLDDSNTIYLAFFGGIYPTLQREAFLNLLRQQVDKTKMNFLVLSAGKIGENNSQWVFLERNSPSKVIFQKLGPLTAGDVSYLLQKMDYGLSSYLDTFWSKSGAIAAMLAHDLSVITLGPFSVLDDLRTQIGIHPSIMDIHSLNGLRMKKRKMTVKPDGLYNIKIFEKHFIQL